jgi:hypothetical protein
MYVFAVCREQVEDCRGTLYGASNLVNTRQGESISLRGEISSLSLQSNLVVAAFIILIELGRGEAVGNSRK